MTTKTNGRKVERATMTPKEVSEYTGICLSKVYDMLAQGEIPSRHIGTARYGKWLISREWVVNWIQNGETTPITQRN